MTCYRDGGCGPYEMLSCGECPASKPEYLERYEVSVAKPKESNFAKIQAMDRFGLADFLAGVASCAKCPASTRGCGHDCIQRWRDWLLKEGDG